MNSLRLFYLSGDSGTAPEIVFDALSLEDRSAAAQGMFSAFVCRRDNMFAEPNMSDCRQVEGTFDTVLRKADCNSTNPSPATVARWAPRLP